MNVRLLTWSLIFATFFLLPDSSAQSDVDDASGRDRDSVEEDAASDEVEAAEEDDDDENFGPGLLPEDVFAPSEEIEADSDVSLPVDI